MFDYVRVINVRIIIIIIIIIIACILLTLCCHSGVIKILIIILILILKPVINADDVSLTMGSVWRSCQALS